MIPVYFTFAVLIIGVSTPVWFGRWLPPVRKLRKGATWLDNQHVSTPSVSSLDVRTLREHEHCGDKIVVAHHLADWTRDLQRKIFNTLALNTVALLVLVVVFAVKGDARLQTTTAGFRDLMVAVTASWPFSIGLAFTLLEMLVFIKLVSDQAEKYRKVIDAAKPAPVSIDQRVRNFLNSIF